MENSILISIKKLLGIDKDYTQFDTDILIHINTAFMILKQLGVGPEDGFIIEDANAEWSEFIQESDGNVIEGVKSWIYIKVKTLFDPSGSAAVNDSLKRQAEELEWRLTNSF